MPIVFRRWLLAVALLAAPAGLCSAGVLLSSSPLGGEAAVGYGLAEDASGRLVVAGVVSDSTGAFHLALWRFSPKDELEGFSFLEEPSWGWALALDERGRPLAAGFGGGDWRKAQEALLARFLPDGRLDDSFGDGGVARASAPLAAAHALALLPDGGIALAGDAGDSEEDVQGALWSFSPEGRLLSSRRLPSPTGRGETRIWALRREGDALLAAGTVDWRRLAFWRLSADKAEVAAATSTEAGMGRAIAVEPGGRAWVGGFSYSREGEKVTGELTRLSLFDGQGRPLLTMTLPPPEGVRERESFALTRSTKDGRMYLAGYAGDKDGPVRACFWSLEAEGKLRKVWSLPNAAEGKEDRAYALLLDSRGRLRAAGFSRGPDRKMHLAVWTMPAD